MVGSRSDEARDRSEGTRSSVPGTAAPPRCGRSASLRVREPIPRYRATAATGRALHAWLDAQRPERPCQRHRARGPPGRGRACSCNAPRASAAAARQPRRERSQHLVRHLDSRRVAREPQRPVAAGRTTGARDFSDDASPVDVARGHDTLHVANACATRRTSSRATTRSAARRAAVDPRGSARAPTHTDRRHGARASHICRGGKPEWRLMREQRRVQLETDLESVAVLERRQMLMVLVAALLRHVRPSRPAVAQRQIPRALRALGRGRAASMSPIGRSVGRAYAEYAEPRALQQQHVDAVALRTARAASPVGRAATRAGTPTRARGAARARAPPGRMVRQRNALQPLEQRCDRPLSRRDRRSRIPNRAGDPARRAAPHRQRGPDAESATTPTPAAAAPSTAASAENVSRSRGSHRVDRRGRRRLSHRGGQRRRVRQASLGQRAEPDLERDEPPEQVTVIAPLRAMLAHQSRRPPRGRRTGRSSRAARAARRADDRSPRGTSVPAERRSRASDARARARGTRPRIASRSTHLPTPSRCLSRLGSDIANSTT